MSRTLSMFKSLLTLLLFTVVGLDLFGYEPKPEEPKVYKEFEKLALTKNVVSRGGFVSFESLEGWQRDNHAVSLSIFKKECQLSRLPSSLKRHCAEAYKAQNAQQFFETHFRPFLLQSTPQEEELLTGYYEPEFNGSLSESPKYQYPLYKRPKDLVIVTLDSVYPSLKKYKLRGRMKGKKVVPYYSRAEINAGLLKERPLCYLQSDVDRFFLQVQGSGRIRLEKGKTMFVGYDGQNGHPYHSIGKALVASGAITQEKISLQSIRIYLDTHPSKAKTILESNPSFVFFGKRKQAASGALGLVLTPMRSVAVDRSKIPLGFPLFLEAKNPITKEPIKKMVFAQDTGGAIKGQVRADLFCGFGKDAEALAGGLQSPLKLYVLVPNNSPES